MTSRKVLNLNERLARKNAEKSSNPSKEELFQTEKEEVVCDLIRLPKSIARSVIRNAANYFGFTPEDIFGLQ